MVTHKGIQHIWS